MFDVVVIGGGVIGGLLLREISKYNINCALLEAENDVAMGQSKANSGIVHAGFDANAGSLKAKFNLLGNQMMPKIAQELGVKYINNGSLVVAFSQEDLIMLDQLKKRGEQNGVEGLQILTKEQLQLKEPNISEDALGALYAPTSGIICPYELTIASIGNAMDNGAKLYTNFKVCKVLKEDESFVVESEKGEKVSCKVLINASGLSCEKVANMAGDYSFKMGARKGEYILLDKECSNFVSHTLFFTPTKAGKGILVTQTVDGNILLGPTSTEQQDGSTVTSQEGLAFVIQKVNQMVKSAPLFNTITSFAGVRAYCDRHDFIIEKSQCVDNLINLAGIESPGLTSAPAIAEYVVNELIATLLPLEKKENFKAERKPDYFFKNLNKEQKNEIIKENPLYGKIVCRCEEITEGEIVRAIHENPPARDVDAIKRRTRATMGRCQGGFCQPRIVEILARELGVDMTEVTKSGEGSQLVWGKTK